MKLSEKQAIFTENVARLILWAKEQGYRLTFGEVFRPPETALMYSKKGIGIANSLHCRRLAVDFNLFIDGEYQQRSEAYERIGTAWKALHENNRWGGDFKNRDGNHFEMTE